MLVVVGIDRSGEALVAVLHGTIFRAVFGAGKSFLNGMGDWRWRWKLLPELLLLGRQGWWACYGTPAAVADIRTLLVLRGVPVVVLVACSSLPDGVVLVVVPQEVAEGLEGASGDLADGW